MDNAELEKAFEMLERQDEGWVENQGKEFREKARSLKEKVKKLEEVMKLMDEDGSGWVCKKNSQ